MIRATRELVCDIPAPPRTKTWGVLPHGQVVAAMDAGCRNVGLPTDGPDFSERYELSGDGAKMFALWSFGQDEIVPSVGFRNSTDKTMTWGIASGSYVYVCGNMQFVGSYLDFQKHIGKLTFETAFDFATDTIQRVYNKSKQIVDWNYSLRKVKITGNDRKAYWYDQFINRIISLKYINKHRECLEEEQKVAEEYGYNPDSLYVHHGATTRLLNSYSMPTVFDKTNTLYGITDDYYMQLAA